MKKSVSLLLSVLAALCAGCSGDAPAPYGAVPSERQLAWHDMQMYAFIHFTTTTYRDVEWGYGDASPDEFQPSRFNPRQWVEVLKAAGMKGVVLTAKHHDGFCLWPSRLTDYSVAHSSWLDGKGDVVGALAAEAERAGLKFGIYLSPWDRHDLRYGSPEYIGYYRGQLEELLTQYGPIFEVWKDGANAWLSGKVIDTIDLGTHTLFVADVTDGEILDPGTDSATYSFYHKNIKPAPPKKEETPAAPGKYRFRCKICGYIYESDTDTLPPDFVCPLCKHGAEDFERI